MLIATFNANSIRARLDATLAWLEKNKPDVLGIQETKVADKEFPREAFEKAGWKLALCGQKTYNGVCFVSRRPLETACTSFADGIEDTQARLIAARLGDVHIINVYVPQGSEVGSDKFRYKLEWLGRLRAYLDKHYKPSQQVVLLGDFNVAPEDIDVYAPDFFEGEVGLHPDERAALEKIRAWGFVDMFRKLHPGLAKQYSFFDYRVKDSAKFRKGWRIDHIWATEPLAAKVKRCEIDMAPRMADKASDHTFVVAEFGM